MKRKPNLRPQTIDLDELLTGKPDWPAVANFFQNGEFYEEFYLIDAIKKYLLTNEQKQILFDNNILITDCLNGRISPEHCKIRDQIFNQWNEKLGFKSFGF